ncbi:MAG: MFS transporter [Pseudomonadales bacterium]
MSIHHLIDNKAILSACLLSAAGALVFNAFPQVLTAIAVEFEMGEADVGSLISAYMGAFALIALFAPLWMPRVNWKSSSIAAYCLVTIGILLLNQFSKEQIVFAMAIMGLGSGILFTISVGIISAAKDPDRGFGFKLTAEMVLGAILIFVVANIIAGEFGYAGFVYGALCLYLLTGIGLLWLPENFLGKVSEEVDAQKAGGVNLPAILASAGLFIFFGAYTGVWSFAAHIGAEHGIDEASINTTLTLALISGIGGALLCAWIGQNFGQKLPLIGGMITMIAAILLLIYGQGMLSYAIAICTINALLQFVAAYQMGLITEVDNTGRFTVMIAFILASSAAISGDLMGSLIESQGMINAMLISVFAIVIAIVLSLVTLKLAPEAEHHS